MEVEMDFAPGQRFVYFRARAAGQVPESELTQSNGSL